MSARLKLVAILRNVLVLIFGLGFGFAILEFGLRVSGRFEVSSVEEDCNVLSDDPKLMYQLKPGCEDVNSYGMREGREYAKESSDFRIAVIGDSIAYGPKVRPEKTFSRDLENLINHDGRYRSVQVLNFGVQGYSTVQEVEILRAHGLQFHPRIVIVQYFLNDEKIYTTIMDWLIQDLRHERFDEFESALNPSLSSFRHWLSRTRTMIALRFAYLKLTRADEPTRRALAPEHWGEVNNNVITQFYADKDPVRMGLSDLKRLSEQYGFQVLFTIFPYHYDHVNDYPQNFRETETRAMKLCKDFGFACLNLRETFADDPDFQKLGGEDLFWDPCCHLTKKGHEVSADVIFRKLQSMNVLP